MTSAISDQANGTPATVTIALSPERSRELRRLAEKAGQNVEAIATKLLEDQIEAEEHGLDHGPFLRRYLYR
jgi:predicted transcriptional regulator